MRVRSHDGINLNLRLMGGDGPGLLICHATGFHGGAYQPLGAGLSERFKVWALDFRGHGASDPSPSGEYEWANMAADVIACARAIEADRLFGFGHSMGGAALLMADISEPDLFDGFFLYEPIVLPEGDYQRRGPQMLAEAARRRRDVFDSRSDALTRYARRFPLNVLRADALAAYVEGGFVDLDDGRVGLACRPEVEASVFESGGAITLDDLDSVRTATTVAAGTVFVDASAGQFAPSTAASLRNGRFARCDGLGHFGPLEAPGIIAEHIIDALLDNPLAVS